MTARTCPVCAAAPEHHDGFDCLVSDLRRSGFDLRRCVFLAFLVEMGPAREGAVRLLRRARHEGWDASLYGDSTGWVVRLARTTRLRPETVARDRRSVDRLAAAHRGTVRGFTVEELRSTDRWAGLAAQQRRRSAVPAPRRPSHAAGQPPAARSA